LHDERERLPEALPVVTVIDLTSEIVEELGAEPERERRIGRNPVNRLLDADLRLGTEVPRDLLGGAEEEG
jgi:hypothetical protein